MAKSIVRGGEFVSVLASSLKSDEPIVSFEFTSPPSFDYFFGDVPRWLSGHIVEEVDDLLLVKVSHFYFLIRDGQDASLCVRGYEIIDSSYSFRTTVYKTRAATHEEAVTLFWEYVDKILPPPPQNEVFLPMITL